MFVDSYLFCSTTFLPQESQQTTPKQHMQPLSHQAQFHPLQQSHHQHHINQSQHIAHFSHNQQCGPQSHLPEIAQPQQSPSISPHMACLQQFGNVGGRMHIMVRDLFILIFLDSRSKHHCVIYFSFMPTYKKNISFMPTYKYKKL